LWCGPVLLYIHKEIVTAGFSEGDEPSDKCDHFHVRIRGLLRMVKYKLRTWVQRRDGTRVGDSRASECGSTSLQACKPPRALVLEGSLDHWLHSTRSEEDLLRTWLKANGVTLAYKNIYSLEDINILGGAIGSNRPLFVHISCHGWYKDGHAYIRFAPGSSDKYDLLLNDLKTIRTFKQAFKNLPILFSACELGKHQHEMQLFTTSTRLPCVAAFSREIYDAESMLFELLLYHGVYNNAWKFETSVDKAIESLSNLKVRGGIGKAQALVRVFNPVD
jgi:hypothetical protein